MSQNDLSVIAIGNAIVDILANTDDAFLKRHDIPKGGMMLIDEQKAASILADMHETVKISGGSAANSIACIASLGGKAGFIGKVGQDEIGDVFRGDMETLGVCFETKPINDATPTGHCLIAVTDDAQRSMSTHLGAAGYVSVDDIDEAFVTRANIVFFEGYLFEQESPRAAFVKSCEIARQHNIRTALTLSDAGCVERQFNDLHAFIPENIQILLANQAEATALCESDDLSQIIDRLKLLSPLSVITRSEKGSVVVPRDGEIIEIDAIAPTELVDTTGAGDAFAAGFLYSIAKNPRELKQAALLGSLAASEIISHVGARPEENLATLAQKAGLEI